MGVEFRLHLGLSIRLDGLAGLELGIAMFADADGNRGQLYYPEFALKHGLSLAHYGE